MLLFDKHLLSFDRVRYCARSEGHIQGKMRSLHDYLSDRPANTCVQYKKIVAAVEVCAKVSRTQKRPGCLGKSKKV